MENLMKQMDYWYEYSEDHVAFIRGNGLKIKIIRWLKSIPVDERLSLINKYVPQQLKEEYESLSSVPLA